MSDASPEGPALLVVEDDSELSTSLLLYLESEGYDVTLAEDGETALKEATRLPGHDLIVLDAKLPDLNGFEVLRQARDDGVRTPVLMLTGLRDHEHRMRGFQVGADDAEEEWSIQSVYGIGYKLEGAERVAESQGAA